MTERQKEKMPRPEVPACRGEWVGGSSVPYASMLLANGPSANAARERDHGP